MIRKSQFILPLLIFITSFLTLSITYSQSSAGNSNLNNIYDQDYSKFLKSSDPLIQKNAYAIVIGISDYPGSDYDLSYCDDDALDVYDMLIDEYNFKSENIIYLQGSSATKSAINSAFDTINSQITDNDVFFFYYSGHGGASVTSEGIFYYDIDSPHPYPNYYDHTWSIYYSGAAYMRVYFDHLETESGYDYVYLGDTDIYDGWVYEGYSGYSSGFWSGWIPLLSDQRLYIRFISDYSYTDWGFSIDRYEVMTYNGTQYLCSYDSIPSSPENYYLDTLLDSKLDAMNAAEKYIITDSCNSGGIIPEVGASGRYIMTACGDSEFSLEDPDLQHGVFTNYFLNSINSATDSNGDGVLSMEEYFSYTSSNTISYSSSLGYTHHPQQYDGISGQAVLSTAIGSLNMNPSGNSLSYSFNLYGTGLIEELYLALCHVSSVVNFSMEDLTLSTPTTTGFGSYSGTVQFDGVPNLTGYGLYAKIEGNRIIYLNNSVSADYDGDSLTDLDEIFFGLNPLTADSDSDGLDDDFEYYGDTDPLNNDTDGDLMLDGYEVINNLDPLIDDASGDLDGDGLSNLLEFQTGTSANNNDTDSDDLSDASELYTYLTDPTNEDTDNDDLSDGDEILVYNTDPLNNDTDGDGMSDGFEVTYGFDNSLDDSSLDTDDDGLTNLLEYEYNSNPLLPDTDGDGIDDGVEVFTYSTDPSSQDTDGDGMDDLYEINYDLNPLTDDSMLDIDGDGLINILEYEFGSCPLLCDSDGDFMTDCYEYDCQLDPTLDDANLDFDGDGLTNLLEFLLNSLADDSDTDGDLMPDGWEYENSLNLTIYDANLDNDGDGLVNLYEYLQQTDPNHPDTDTDGLNDGDEVEIYNTDPLNPDSDGDGFMDGIEVAWGANPLDPNNSLFNVFYNYLGFAFLISGGYFIARTTLVSKRQKKKTIESKSKYTIDKSETYNALKVEKDEKPKPKVYTPMYPQRPSYPYLRSMAPLSPSEINQLKNTILYRLPPPKSPYSQEGRQAIYLANVAMNEFKNGNILSFSKHLIQALMMGVPEPMNSSLKVLILDILNKMAKEASRSQVAPRRTVVDSQPQVKKEPQISSDFRYCGYCGRKNKRTNKFCTNCGRVF